MLPDNLEDTQRYYSDVFFRLKPYDYKNKKYTGDFQWCFINDWVPLQYEDNPRKHFWCPQVTWQDSSADAYYRTPITPENCDLALAESRYYFNGNEAIYLKRRPARNVHKCLSFYNGRFVNPLEVLVPSNFVRAFDNDFDSNMEHIHDWLTKLNTPNPMYSFISAKFNLMRDDNVVSIPIAKHWCLTKAPSHLEECILWYKLSPVCMINGYQGRLIAPAFKQEITDRFPEIRLL